LHLKDIDVTGLQENFHTKNLTEHVDKISHYLQSELIRFYAWISLLVQLYEHSFLKGQSLLCCDWLVWINVFKRFILPISCVNPIKKGTVLRC